VALYYEIPRGGYFFIENFSGRSLLCPNSEKFVRIRHFSIPLLVLVLGLPIVFFFAIILFGCPGRRPSGGRDTQGERIVGSSGNPLHLKEVQSQKQKTIAPFFRRIAAIGPGEKTKKDKGDKNSGAGLGHRDRQAQGPARWGNGWTGPRGDSRGWFRGKVFVLR